MTITNEEPKIPKNRKYFFGYYDWCGRACAMKWMEDDGIVVGGIPTPIIEKYEIDLYDYDHTLLVVLESKYPVSVPEFLKLPKGTPPDLT